jgi:hypothetical protein
MRLEQVMMEKWKDLPITRAMEADSERKKLMTQKEFDDMIKAAVAWRDPLGPVSREEFARLEKRVAALEKTSRGEMTFPHGFVPKHVDFLPDT